MHWGSWLLYVPMIFGAILGDEFLAADVLYFVSGGVFLVYAIIWYWKMFIAVNRPGWWALMIFIWPVLLILIEVAAWGGNSENHTPAHHHVSRHHPSSSHVWRNH